MIKNNKNNKKGFAILFAVTLSSILLSIALGVTNIALKELKFSTSAKATNDAFFAADTGIECALFNDKSPTTSFPQTGGSGIVNCLGATIPLNGSYPDWSFTLSEFGGTGRSCAKVTLSRSLDNSTNPPSIATLIVSKGYNNGDSSCNSTNADRIERELRVMY